MYKNESFEHMFEAFVLLKGCFKNICRKKKVLLVCDFSQDYLLRA